MATVSRWRSSRPVRTRLELVSLEVVLLAIIIFVAGISDLSPVVWLVLVSVSVVVQSALFYHLGRVREKLDR
jgi:hypothetical protein